MNVPVILSYQLKITIHSFTFCNCFISEVNPELIPKSKGKIHIGWDAGHHAHTQTHIDTNTHSFQLEESKYSRFTGMFWTVGKKKGLKQASL